MDVDDVVQEVFLVVADKIKGFRGEARITTWLFRITANVVRNRRRRERQLRWLAGFGDSLARSLMAATPGPSDELEGDEARDRIYRALDGLSDVLRSTFIMFEFEGLSGEEVAELTGVRLQAVRMRLSRARQQFIQRYVELEAQS